MDRSRAALYLTMGEPYINSIWFEMFKKNAMDDIDMLYIAVDPQRNDIPVANRDYFIKLFSNHPKVTILHNSHASLQSSLQSLFNNCREKYYVLLQDDCFVTKKHGLVPYFDDIETGYYDIIGTPLRNYTPQSFHDQLKKAFGGKDADWGYYPFQHIGYSLWQNMVFGKTQDMLDTGAKFDQLSYGGDSFIDFLGFNTMDSVGLDIFVPEVLKLRMMGKKFGYNDQGFLSRDDLQDYLNQRGVFTGSNAWLHLGTMSNFYGELLRLDEIKKDTDPTTKLETARRVAWYLLFTSWYPEVEKAIPAWGKQVNDYLKQLYLVLQFDKRDFGKRLQIYSELLKK